MKKWMVGMFVMSLAIGAPGTARAFDLGDLDPAEWLDECTVGKFLSAGMDGILYANGTSYPYIGTSAGSVVGGECDASDVHMLDFHMREVRPRWGYGSTVTNGKLMVDIQRQYGFDTNDNGAIDTWTLYGDIWRWKKASTGEYKKARYTLTSTISNGATLQMSMNGGALANTGSQTPASYATGTVSTPTGYNALDEVQISGTQTSNSPYSVVSNGVRIWHVLKNVKGKSIVKNAAGYKKTVIFSLGQVHAKSVPKNGKRYQHIVYLPPV